MLAKSLRLRRARIHHQKIIPVRNPEAGPGSHLLLRLHASAIQAALQVAQASACGFSPIPPSPHSAQPQDSPAKSPAPPPSPKSQTPTTSFSAATRREFFKSSPESPAAFTAPALKSNNPRNTPNSTATAAAWSASAFPYSATQCAVRDPNAPTRPDDPQSPEPPPGAPHAAAPPPPARSPPNQNEFRRQASLRLHLKPPARAAPLATTVSEKAGEEAPRSDRNASP